MKTRVDYGEDANIVHRLVCESLLCSMECIAIYFIRRSPVRCRRSKSHWLLESSCLICSSDISPHEAWFVGFMRMVITAYEDSRAFRGHDCTVVDVKMEEHTTLLLILIDNFTAR